MNKKITLKSYTLPIFMLLFTLLSCEKDSDLAEKLIGKWKVETIEITDPKVHLPFNVGDILTLNNNNKFETSQDKKGTWVISDKHLELTFESPTSYRFTANMEKSGSKLKIYRKVRIPNPHPSPLNEHDKLKIFSIELRKIE